MWVLLPLIAFLSCVWSLYYFYFRGHSFRELYRTKYLLGPSESALSAVKQGRVSRSLRVELRGSARAKRARTVRASEPAGSVSTTAVNSPRVQGVMSSSAAVDPDVLLSVCYAPNVPRSDSDLSAPARRTEPVSPRTPGGTRIVDLSEATDLLLRSTDQQPVTIGFEPAYARNVPNQSQDTFSSKPGSGAGPLGAPSSPRRAPTGGLTAVAEELQAGTWQDGTESQTTWITTEEHPQASVPSGVLPREPGLQTSLPSPRDGSGFMLRI